MIDYNTYIRDCLEFYRALIRTPSVNGADNEQAVAKLIMHEAGKLGLPSRAIEEEPGRPNVFVGDGFNSADNLLLVAHQDTVPAGEIKKWTHDPFAADIANGRLYGRGAADCKGGIAVSLYVLKILKDEGKPHLAKFLAGADEESGADSHFGIRAALRQGLKAKGAVYTYNGSQSNEFVIGHRGVVRVWVTCEGESVHSGSVSWQDGVKGASAITGMIKFLDQLSSIKSATKNEFFPEYKMVITPTRMTAGEGESIVPGKAEVLLDIRTLPGDNERVLAKLHDLTHNMSREKWRFTLTIKTDIPGVVADPESAVVKEMLSLVKSLYCINNPVLRGSGPANESYMLIEHGIPTIVGFGPVGGNYHAADEYAEVDSIQKSLEFLVNLSLNLKGA